MLNYRIHRYMNQIIILILFILFHFSGMAWSDQIKKRATSQQNKSSTHQAHKKNKKREASQKNKKHPQSNKHQPISLIGFKTLEAKFEQKQFYSFMQMPVKTFGKIYLSANKMVWEITHPSRSKIILVGERAWLIYPNMRYRKNIGGGQHQIMAIVARNLSLLCRADMKGLEHFYKVIRKKAIWLLTPKNKAMKKMIALLRLKMNPHGYADWVEVRAPDGDRMEVSFSKVILNQKLPKQIFSFKDSKVKK